MLVQARTEAALQLAQSTCEDAVQKHSEAAAALSALKHDFEVILLAAAL
jgi:hypothetical protein